MFTDLDKMITRIFKITNAVCVVITGLMIYNDIYGWGWVFLIACLAYERKDK